MLIEVKVPQLPESVSEATLVSWKKKVGEYVERDENLIDLETDKVVLELPAPQAGVIVSLVQGDGATVVSHQLIATIDTEAKAGASAASAPAAAPIAQEPTRVAAAAAAAGVPENAIGFGTAVMPAAKKAAADAGIDTSKIQGLGPRWPRAEGRRGRCCRQAGGRTRSQGCPGSGCGGTAGRSRRTARADVASASARRRAPGRIAIDRRHPHHLQ